MNTLIPIDYYQIFYYNVVLVFVFIVFFQSFVLDFESPSNLRLKNNFGIAVLTFLIAYIGLRPISQTFGDMMNYDAEIQQYKNGLLFDEKKDFLFELFKFFFAKYFSSAFFFFVCAVLYVVPLYYATKKFFQAYWFYAFFMLVISFSFWAYGVNGIRNGIATSLFIFAISRDKKLVRYALFLAILLIHKSMLIPIAVYFVVAYYNNTKAFLIFWLLCIPLSLALGGFWENFFMSFGVQDERVQGYLGGIDQASEGVTLNVGFRWDFLLYSASGIVAAWYFLLKKEYENAEYNLICNLYVVANAFWILVIRASYSNRIAYLSWFLLGLVIIYPLLKNRLYDNQHRTIGFIVIAYFGFTYLLNVILAT